MPTDARAALRLLRGEDVGGAFNLDAQARV